ncbi:hypothetical protein PybrP1_013147 [[Pythium] brassicae (nom. inval.)]|nr:hypothetical protein PybrP1_013147 [[Pythium] brassicae (nom. inval.)]
MAETKLTTNDLLLVILCVLLPPVAVFLQVGVTLELALNVVLTIFFFIPGLLHALYVLWREHQAKRSKEEELTTPA